MDYPRKSAGNRIKAAKQDTSSQPAPTICHCSAMMLHLAGFEAAQKRWQGSAPEAQLFAWICLVVPWRWHRRFGGWKPELGRRLSELVRACPSLSELVRACPSLSMCNARCLSSHAGQGTSLARHENQMLRLVQCAVPCGNCLCTNIQSRMDNLSAARKRKWFVGTGRALWSTW